MVSWRSFVLIFLLCPHFLIFFFVVVNFVVNDLENKRLTHERSELKRPPCWLECRLKASIAGAWLQNWTGSKKTYVQNVWGVQSCEVENLVQKLEALGLFFLACLLRSSLELNKIFRLNPCKLKSLRMEFFWMHTLPFLFLSLYIFLHHTHTHTLMHPLHQCNKHTMFASALCVPQIIWDSIDSISHLIRRVFSSSSSSSHCFCSCFCVNVKATKSTC